MARRPSIWFTRGHEFGTNTGRRRRVGLVRRGHGAPSRSTEFAHRNRLTKLDVLDKFDEIKVCVGYLHDGVRYDYVPFHQSVLHDVTPIYETLRGWQSELTSFHRFEELPIEAARLRALPRRTDWRAHFRGRRRS